MSLRTIMVVAVLSSPASAGDRVSWDLLFSGPPSPITATIRPTQSIWWVGMAPSPLIHLAPDIRQFRLPSWEGAPLSCLMLVGSDGKSYYVAESQIDTTTYDRIKQAWRDVGALKTQPPASNTTVAGSASRPPFLRDSVKYSTIPTIPATNAVGISMLSKDLTRTGRIGIGATSARMFGSTDCGVPGG